MEAFLRDYPGLKPFVLSDVQLTGTKIGGGGYGEVEEVDIPVRAAAKMIYAFFQEGDETTEGLPKAATEFARECKLMSTLRHPNIVQFFGVTFVPGSRLPALVMERLLTSLHDLLVPSRPPPRGVTTPLSFFSMHLKCCVLHNVASGLAYLHELSEPIIHRDMSARNVLLDSNLVAKIADLGVARIIRDTKFAATMTKGPGNLVYMPPEAFAEKSKYDASIDIFSFGVITIFAIGEVFPCDPLASTYMDEDSGSLIARTELQRRSKYIKKVDDKLQSYYGQLRKDHPLIMLIQQCLNNSPRKRPSIREVLGLLERARGCFSDRQSERNRCELVKVFDSHPRNQILVRALQDLVTENGELKSVIQEMKSSNQELEQKLHSQISLVESLKLKNRGLEEELHSQVQEKGLELVVALQQLQLKKEELTREEETIRKKMTTYQSSSASHTYSATRSSHSSSSPSFSYSAPPTDDGKKKKMIVIRKEPKENLGILLAKFPNESGFRVIGVELDSPGYHEWKKGNIKLLDIVTELNEDTVSSVEWFEHSTRDKTRPSLTLWRSTNSPEVDKFLSKVKERCPLATHIRLILNPVIFKVGTNFGIEPILNTGGHMSGMIIKVTPDSSAHLCGVTIRDELLMHCIVSGATKTISDLKYAFSISALKGELKSTLESGKHLLLVLKRHPKSYI